jgi:methionyl aminopeptidase
MIATQESDIANLRMSGKILAEVLTETAKLTVPGVTAAELDLAAERMIRERGGLPAFLNYQPDGAAYPFPAALCVSINDEVVHGIPTEDTVIKDGDLVMLDLGVSYNGFFSDAALTVPVGNVDAAGMKLLNASREALAEALKVVKAGAHVGDIGAAIQAVARKYNFTIAKDLGGHALGKVPHEKPYIPNEGEVGTGEVLKEGLVIAIEPIFCEGKPHIVLGEDDWTYHTKDGLRSTEFEQTLMVTKDGCEVLTPF